MSDHPWQARVKIPQGRLWRIHQKCQHLLPLWTVYSPHTLEYPGVWVARMHLVLPRPRPTRFVFSHDTLEELRELLPPGLTRLDRDPGDPPQIVEVWL
jgi:hypothetical protein